LIVTSFKCCSSLPGCTGTLMLAQPSVFIYTMHFRGSLLLHHQRMCFEPRGTANNYIKTIIIINFRSVRSIRACYCISVESLSFRFRRSIAVVSPRSFSQLLKILACRFYFRKSCVQLNFCIVTLYNCAIFL
jgi:hypothetical protein